MRPDALLLSGRCPDCGHEPPCCCVDVELPAGTLDPPTNDARKRSVADELSMRQGARSKDGRYLNCGECDALVFRRHDHPIGASHACAERLARALERVPFR
jgi:hypothetical protein